jgi:aminoethylphosphonate catabolism LysR family transcriptional regulator
LKIVVYNEGIAQSYKYADDMQYAQLRAFHAVAEYGGFSKAAHALGLTQPAVSDHVRRLEQAYGVTLFNRSGRGVETTELGRRLSTVTRQLFDCERDAHDILTSASSLSSGTLNVVADAPDLAVKLITALRAAYPGVMVKLSIANAEACIEQVLSSTADAAVTAAPQVDSRLHSRILRREPLVALLPADHALARKTRISFADFVREPLIFREPGSVTQKLLSAELMRHGLRAEPVMLVEGREALEQSVANGLGLGTIARAEFNGSRRIRLVPFIDCQAEMVESLVRLADRPPSTLLDTVFEVAAKLE